MPSVIQPRPNTRNYQHRRDTLGHNVGKSEIFFSRVGRNKQNAVTASLLAYHPVCKL